MDASRKDDGISQLNEFPGFHSNEVLPAPVPMHYFSFPFMEEDGTSIDMNIRVENVVVQPQVFLVRSTVQFNCAIDCANVTTQLTGCRLTKTGQLCAKILDPKTTITINSSGKLTCWGAKTVAACFKVSYHTAVIFKMLGYYVRPTNFCVDNICAMLKLPFGVKLEMMAEMLSDKCSYEPELFSALKFPLSEPKVHLWIFHTGCVTLLGAKNFNQIIEAFRRMTPMLEYFKIKPHGLPMMPLPVVRRYKKKSSSTHFSEDSSTENAFAIPTEDSGLISVTEESSVIHSTEELESSCATPAVSFEEEENSHSILPMADSRSVMAMGESTVEKVASVPLLEDPIFTPSVQEAESMPSLNHPVFTSSVHESVSSMPSLEDYSTLNVGNAASVSTAEQPVPLSIMEEIPSLLAVENSCPILPIKDVTVSNVVEDPSRISSVEESCSLPVENRFNEPFLVSPMDVSCSVHHEETRLDEPCLISPTEESCMTPRTEQLSTSSVQVAAFRSAIKESLLTPPLEELPPVLITGEYTPHSLMKELCSMPHVGKLYTDWEETISISSTEEFQSPVTSPSEELPPVLITGESTFYPRMKESCSMPHEGKLYTGWEETISISSTEDFQEYLTPPREKSPVTFITNPTFMVSKMSSDLSVGESDAAASDGESDSTWNLDDSDYSIEESCWITHVKKLASTLSEKESATRLRKKNASCIFRKKQLSALFSDEESPPHLSSSLVRADSSYTLKKPRRLRKRKSSRMSYKNESGITLCGREPPWTLSRKEADARAYLLRDSDSTSSTDESDSKSCKTPT